MAGNQGNNRIVWTAEMDNFLKDNLFSMTNPQLAENLGLKLTVVRNRCSELGLKRQEKGSWTDEQKEFLKSNYQTMGNQELIDHLKLLDENPKSWSKSKITSQMNRMGLRRTEEEMQNIWRKHLENNRYGTNAINLEDKYIAGILFKGVTNKTIRRELAVNHPELIELKRQQLLLNRSIKEARK